MHARSAALMQLRTRRAGVRQSVLNSMWMWSTQVHTSKFTHGQQATCTEQVHVAASMAPINFKFMILFIPVLPTALRIIHPHSVLNSAIVSKTKDILCKYDDNATLRFFNSLASNVIVSELEFS
uniref:Uncharacterized protein n=1 Tax=Lotharella oceanica TaxID=641309 RepID=A0A7S2TW96_9EUKA